MAASHRRGLLEIATNVAPQSTCGGREVEEASAQKAEVPRLRQLSG